jgi:ankyrin repeat protein
MAGPLFGEKSQEKLHFVPNADTNREEKHEICEPALFRFLLNEKTIEDQAEIQTMLNTLNCIDKLSKITIIEIHESSMGSVKDLGKAFHAFIVFQTTSGKDEDFWWWSFEKNMEYIVLQRSRNKNDVKDNLYGKKRNNVKAKAENLAGKGTIKDLFVMVWAYQVIPEKYHIIESNCQSLVTLVSKEITENRYEYKGLVESNPLLRYFYKCLPREEKRNMEMLDLINILSMCFERKGHPLFNLIYYEKPDLFDKVMESGNYDINDIFTDHRMTTLHLAIVISSPEMVRHLLEKWEADPTQRDRKGRTALHLAALYAQENVEKIIDMLLEHIKVDERDLYKRRTALHYAVCACNSIAVRHLIDKGADLDSSDKDGQSSLHLAACHEKGTEIVDLILQAKNSKRNNEGIDDYVYEFEITALHMAVIASNETTADYLIIRGADINYRDKCGRTPLHLAVAFAQDINIIKLLLKHIKKEDIEKQYKNDENIIDYAEKNKNGLGQEIIARLRRKGIFGKKKDPTFSIMEDESNKESDETVASNEKTGITLAKQIL